jgi:hypothetical protein
MAAIYRVRDTRPLYSGASCIERQTLAHCKGTDINWRNTTQVRHRGQVNLDWASAALESTANLVVSDGTIKRFLLYLGTPNIVINHVVTQRFSEHIGTTQGLGCITRRTGIVEHWLVVLVSQ